jgi:Uncharacterised nucleotidyltransferase
MNEFVHRAQRAVLSVGLVDTDSGSDPAAVQDDDWRSFIAWVVARKLTGLGLAACQLDRLQLTEEQSAELLDGHRTAMVHALALERLLLDLANAFDQTGIEIVVLKGPAFAHTAYPDPSWRSFGDLDVLVATSDWARSCELLLELGYRRRFPEPRPGFSERFGRTAAHVNGEGYELDLHRTPAAGPFVFWLDPGELFEHTSSFTIGDAQLNRLTDTASLLHACMHATFGFRPPLPVPLRDIAQFATAGRVDWNLFHELAERWKLRAVVAYAFRTASDTLGLDPPPSWVAIPGEQSSRKERRALEAFTTDRRSHGGSVRASLGAIPGFRAKVAYARALLLPSRDFLTFRLGSDESYLQRWRTPLRWLSRG